MHPPRTRRNAVRTALVVLTALFTLLMAGIPAAAAPIGYETEALAEDYCTLYSTAGDAAWAEIAVEPTVSFSGKAWTTFFMDGRPCLHVEPQPRHLEFVAYDVKGVPLDIERMAVPHRDASYEYAFSLVADETTSIAFVSVGVCRTEPVTGNGEPSANCDGLLFIAPPVEG
ncbi:hypothetical protein [Glycomyces sp. NPDC048151]|uniref:hypothetical protein n=1 Tax=Glycomyces sp. NPDC048151 TaxID=3364002 RepID=UPI00371B8C35